MCDLRGRAAVGTCVWTAMDGARRRSPFDCSETASSVIVVSARSQIQTLSLVTRSSNEKDPTVSMFHLRNDGRVARSVAEPGPGRAEKCLPVRRLDRGRGVISGFFRPEMSNVLIAWDERQLH